MKLRVLIGSRGVDRILEPCISRNDALVRLIDMCSNFDLPFHETVQQVDNQYLTSFPASPKG